MPTRSPPADFFTTEVWTAGGLARYFTLFFIDVATRRVYVAGSTLHPTAEWMAQIARNITDCQDGFLHRTRFLIIDRDSIFSDAVTAILESSGVDVLKTAYQAPNMNAHAERFVRSIRSECLDQMILVGEGSFETAIAEYVLHYHRNGAIRVLATSY